LSRANEYKLKRHEAVNVAGKAHEALMNSRGDPYDEAALATRAGARNEKGAVLAAEALDRPRAAAQGRNKIHLPLRICGLTG
jgi:hypothetical protein